MTPIDFYQAMILLSVRFRFRVTSGYRSEASNARSDIAGHPESRHLTWQAMDVVLDHPTDTLAFCTEGTRAGLVVVDEGDHLHVQGG